MKAISVQLDKKWSQGLPLSHGEHLPSHVADRTRQAPGKDLCRNEDQVNGNRVIGLE